MTLTDEPDPRVLEGFFPDYEGISEECQFLFIYGATQELTIPSNQGGP